MLNHTGYFINNQAIDTLGLRDSNEKMKKRLELNSLFDYSSFMSSVFTEEIGRLKKRRNEELFSIRQAKKEKALFNKESDKNDCSVIIYPYDNESTHNQESVKKNSQYIPILNNNELNYIKEILQSHESLSGKQLRNVMNYIFDLSKIEENRIALIKNDTLLIISSIFKSVRREDSELLESVIMAVCLLCDFNQLEFYQIKSVRSFFNNTGFT
jgi:hypothetical protein